MNLHTLLCVRERENGLGEGILGFDLGSKWVIDHVWLPSLPSLQMPKAYWYNSNWLWESHQENMDWEDVAGLNIQQISAEFKVSF